MIYRALMLCVAITVLVIYLISENKVEHYAQASYWVKIDASGEPINNWAGPWSCILDKKTGLIWENKDDSEGIHDGFWSYSWFESKGGQGKEFDSAGLGVENWGDCHFEKDRCDTQDLINRMRQEKTCGLSQWRLPTANELTTLVINYQQPGEPVIDVFFFLTLNVVIIGLPMPISLCMDFINTWGREPQQSILLTEKK